MNTELSQKSTIKVDRSLKSMLDILKLIPQEPYTKVIERLVFEKFEEDMELNEETKTILQKQMKKKADKKRNVTTGRDGDEDALES